MERFSCDVLVLGSGAAGLRAAISAREAGLRVCVVSKGPVGKSTCTWLSAGVMAGGFNAATIKAHLERTLLAGRGINQPELVEILINEAPERLDELRKWGIEAEFRNGYLFAKGHPPVQGEEIIRCLINRNQELGTQFLSKFMVTDLVIEDGASMVKVFDQPSGEWQTLSAKAIILATGGASALYFRHDNPKRMLGDGQRLALEAGAVLQDMEFVQFYPLCLCGPGTPPLVIPPKLADQGRLVNDLGEDILVKYGIQERPAGEKARDVLSQAIFTEIHRNGQKVNLDLSDVSDQQWRRDPFSASVEHILGNQHGAKHHPVQVAPASHHVMGGV
ncbi:MAG: FAD-dependent oxidoreductase, partial [Desulfomonilaceae bacterium]